MNYKNQYVFDSEIRQEHRRCWSLFLEKVPWRPSSYHSQIVAIFFTLTSLCNVISGQVTQVFIASASDGIYTSELDSETGALSAPQLKAEFKLGGFLALHPNQKVLYATANVAKKQGGGISFAVQSDCSLTEMSRQSAGGGRLCHISLDATSQVLMGANYGDGNVVSFPLTEKGSIGKLASLQQHAGSSINPKRQTKPHAHSIYAGPDNRFAYAPDLGIDKVMVYKLDLDTAKLTTAGFTSLPAGAGPRHMKFGADGKQAYVLNELDCSISIFNRGKSGKLLAKQVVSTLPQGADKNEMTCSEIRVSPNGRFIYCANRDLTEQGRDSISVFKVNQGGALTRIQTIAAGVWIPRNINLDPSGQWLLVAGQKSNDVPVFKVDQETGKLTSTKHKIAVPKAMCIEFVKIEDTH